MNVDAFKNFLKDAGGVILDTTNPWETVRWMADARVCVLYRRKNGDHSFSGSEAEEAFRAFVDKRPYRIVPKERRRKSEQIVDTLLRRDGRKCFYCGHTILKGEESLEHLLSITHGGNNHPANLVLTHHACNQKAGNMSVVEKVRLRENMRANRPQGRAA